MGFELRDYQKTISAKGIEILEKHKMLYLAMEVRCGKTHVALDICRKFNKVLFVTKKKAISSIKKDYIIGGYSFHLEVINYESVHKLPPTQWDVVIMDEAHGMGAFPKASGRAKAMKEIISRSPSCVTIFLSGTPTPESYSQIFHQLWVDFRSPLKYKNFYQFASHHVNKKQKMVSYGRLVNDYSDANEEEIFNIIGHLFIKFTQKEAGFESNIEEEFLYVQMEDETYKLCDRLLKDKVLGLKVIADTPVKLQSKLHQMYSGTIKTEDGKGHVFDLSKAKYIKSRFANQKIAIFYKFKAEFKALKTIFGDKLTEDLDVFDENHDMNIAYQIQSGREGTNLSLATNLVFYNIDFSATSYWQGRDRMTTKDRKENKVWWIFSQGGIEDKVYGVVSGKKTYTNYYFKRDYKIKSKKKQIKDNENNQRR